MTTRWNRRWERWTDKSGITHDLKTFEPNPGGLTRCQIPVNWRRPTNKNTNCLNCIAVARRR